MSGLVSDLGSVCRQGAAWSEGSGKNHHSDHSRYLAVEGAVR
jgi:hypothetical protein